MVYQWKPGVSLKTDPTLAAVIMNDLAAKKQLTPQKLVDISRPEDAPMHKDFEWNDTVAAEKWRRHQGRAIIRALVMVEEAEPQKEPIKAFYSVKALDGSRQYESTRVLIKTEDGREALRREALRELIVFKRKYKNVLEWTKTEKYVDDLIALLERQLEDNNH